MEMCLVCHCTTTVLLYLIVPTINNMEKGYGPSRKTHIYAPNKTSTTSSWGKQSVYPCFLLLSQQCTKIRTELLLLWFLIPRVTVSATSAHHDELIAECEHSALLYEIKCLAQVSGSCSLSFYPTPNHLKSFCFAISKKPCLRKYATISIHKASMAFKSKNVIWSETTKS